MHAHPTTHIPITYRQKIKQSQIIARHTCGNKNSFKKGIITREDNQKRLYRADETEVKAGNMKSQGT